ncbi:MAG: hypothetical protein H6728_03235 [Myxococcales bacterium]|nr:hypothetical protein [Myxococcales bacterium]
MPYVFVRSIFSVRCLLWIGIFFAWAPSVVWSQPLKREDKKGWVEVAKESISVQIQSSTNVEMQVQRNKAGKPEIVGKLSDDQGKGISQAPLVLQLPNKKQIRLRTNKEGRFRKEVVNFPPKGIFTLRFPGQGNLRQSQSRRALDLGRVDATFSAVFPKPLQSGTKEFTIHAKLHYKGTPLPDYPLQLFLGRLEKQKDAAPLIPREDIPPRTCKDLGVPLMSLSTDAKGQVRFVWKGGALEGAARIPLCLMFQGDRYFLPQDRRHMLQILPGKPPPSRSSWPWIAALTLFFLVGLGWFLRKKPVPPAPAAKMLDAEEVLRLHDSEEIVLQRGVRAPQDRMVSGRLTDIYEQRPVARAQIFLAQEGEEIEVTTSRPDGSFQWEAPQDLEGPLLLWIRHPAFREKSLKLPCPHYGEARQLRVGLYSYRFLCLEAFRQGVSSLNKTIDPRKKTAREILALLSDDIAKLMRPLAVGFEHAYYSPKPPSKELYQQVSVALKALMTQDHALLPEIHVPTYESLRHVPSEIKLPPLEKNKPPKEQSPPVPSTQTTDLPKANKGASPEPTGLTAPSFNDAHAEPPLFSTKQTLLDSPEHTAQTLVEQQDEHRTTHQDELPLFPFEESFSPQQEPTFLSQSELIAVEREGLEETQDNAATEEHHKLHAVHYDVPIFGNNETTLKDGDVVVESHASTAQNNEVTVEDNEATAENSEVSAEDNESTAENSEVSAEDNETTAENSETTLEQQGTTEELEKKSHTMEFEREDVEAVLAASRAFEDVQKLDRVDSTGAGQLSAEQRAAFSAAALVVREGLPHKEAAASSPSHVTHQDGES